MLTEEKRPLLHITEHKEIRQTVSEKNLRHVIFSHYGNFLVLKIIILNESRHNVT